MGACRQYLLLLQARQTQDESPVDSDIPCVKLGQPCTLLALPEPVDASHARPGGRVLAATAVGEPGRLALA